MPTYQYACTNPEGRHEFELVQSFTDDPVGTCPECGSAVRKVYGSVGVVFKGSGFYRTDSRNGSEKKKAPSSDKSSSDKSSPEKSSEKSSSSGSSAVKEKASNSSSATPAGGGAKAAAG